MSTSGKAADTDYPVHELIARRWSPYAFDDRPVAQSDLRSLFEAARIFVQRATVEVYRCHKEGPRAVRTSAQLSGRRKPSLGETGARPRVGCGEPEIQGQWRGQ